MAGIFDFILNLDSKTTAQLERLVTSFKLDRAYIFQLTGNHQVLTHAWPKVEEPMIDSQNKWTAFSIETTLPTIFQRLKSFMPFFDPVENLPETQAKFLSDLGSKAAMFIPIQHESILWGYICCLSEKTKRIWKSTELSMAMQESIDMTYNILLKEALTDLQENDEHLRFMLSYVLDGVVTIDEKGVISNVSGFIAELGGYRLGELVGQDLKLFVLKDDWDLLDRNMTKALEDQSIKIIDNYRLLLKTGDIFWARITTMPLLRQGVHMGFVCMISQIDTYKKAEKQLHEYQSFMHYTNELIWITDCELCFTYVSPSIEHLLGYTQEEAMRLNAGHTMVRKVLHNLAKVFTDGLSAVSKGDLNWKAVLPVEHFHRNGTKLAGELLLVIHQDSGGKPAGFIGVTHFYMHNPFSKRYPV